MDREEKEAQEAAEGDVDLDLRSMSDWLINAWQEAEEAESTDNERLASIPESDESRRFAVFKSDPQEIDKDIDEGEADMEES